MADPIPFRKNTKAKPFEDYLASEKLSFFEKRVVGGPSDTVAFVTALPAGPFRIPAAVITDASIYTVIRCHLGDRFVGATDEAEFLEYLRQLNARHACFKYAVNEEGGLYLDVCLPSRENDFDPELIRFVLNLIVHHLQDTYPEIRKWLSLSEGSGQK